MHMPPPKRKTQPYQRREHEDPVWPENVQFEDRFEVIDNWERTKAMLRERLELERSYAEQEIASENEEGDNESSRALEARSGSEPRRVVAEWRNEDGTMSRQFSTGETLIRSADGAIRNEAGVEIRSAGQSEVRILTGEGVNQLR